MVLYLRMSTPPVSSNACFWICWWPLHNMKWKWPRNGFATKLRNVPGKGNSVRHAADGLQKDPDTHKLVIIPMHPVPDKAKITILFLFFTIFQWKNNENQKTLFWAQNTKNRKSLIISILRFKKPKVHFLATSRNWRRGKAESAVKILSHPI